MGYASGTQVEVEQSRAEIERVICRYGADQYIAGFQEGEAIVLFRRGGKHVKFVLPLPSINSREVTHTPAGKKRMQSQLPKALRDETKRRWRALLLLVKAKLEAVASGITEFEDEFLAHIVLPSGQSVSKWLRPQIDQAYESGRMPSNLLALPAPSSDESETPRQER